MMIDIKLWNIKRKIKQHFKFLFDSGFRISSSKYQPEHMGFWEINLFSNTLAMQLYDDRGEIMMMLGTSQNQPRLHSLATVIFYITNSQEFIGNYDGKLSDVDSQLKRLAYLLQKYFKEVQPLFGEDYEKYEAGLDKAYNTILDLSLNSNRKSWSEEDLMKYVPKRKRAG